MTEEDHSQDVDDLIAEAQSEAARWKRAHTIACSNITQLNDQRQLLTDALQNSMVLIDQLLTEMRLANVAPSAGLIVTKAAFDQAMRKVLGQQEDVPSPDA